MAELLAAEGWVKSGSAGSYLRESLPDEYIVVADPRVSGQSLAAVVVGRGALFLVEDLNAEPAEDAGAAAKPGANGNTLVHAAEDFLKDEFPSLKLFLMEVRSARDWAEGPVTWRVSEPLEWADQPLADAIVAADRQIEATMAEDMREELAVGLRDRQLTASQPAAKPFMFPSGGGFRTGTRVSSIRQAVAHMDRYPEDGVKVLRDGTLAAWFEEEGAHHLAALARSVTRQVKTDARAMLETFLLGTGLVGRPALAVEPARLDLGYVVQGQKASHRLRLEKGRGSRGYLFGAFSPGSPWLRVEPREFQGTPAELVVTAETASLQIASTPYLSDIVLSSSASDEPIRVPVSVSVVAEPPGLIRHGVRPLTGLLVGAALGALIGLLWRATGLSGDRDMLLWIVAIAAVWGLAGALRGLRQPTAWPTRYALPRWLLKTALWGAGLGVLAAVVVQAWRLGLGGGLEFEGLSLLAAAVAGASFGVLFATLDELARGRHERDEGYVRGRRSVRRPVLLAAAGIMLLLAAMLAPRVITTAMNRAEVQATAAPARNWVEARWNEFNQSMDRLVYNLTLRYYQKEPGVVGAPTPGPLIKIPERQRLEP